MKFKNGGTPPPRQNWECSFRVHTHPFQNIQLKSNYFSKKFMKLKNEIKFGCTPTNLFF